MSRIENNNFKSNEVMNKNMKMSKTGSNHMHKTHHEKETTITTKETNIRKEINKNQGLGQMVDFVV